ncbi:MAG: hypothetical protein N2559_17485 [Anaerolineae bacterium]|nr:hypothetical protein [Anaerolineae bacterium]
MKYVVGAVVLILLFIAVVSQMKVSDDARAVLYGAVCGIACAFPVSLALVLVSRASHESAPSPREPIVIYRRQTRGDAYRALCESAKQIESGRRTIELRKGGQG